MRERLGESLASIQQMDKAIDQATTSSLEALKAFSLGDQKRNTGSDQEAIPLLPPGASSSTRTSRWRTPGWGPLTRTSARTSRPSSTGRAPTSCATGSASASASTSSATTTAASTQGSRQGARDLRPLEADVSARSGAVYQQRLALLAARRERARARRRYCKAIELDPTRRIAYANLRSGSTSSSIGWTRRGSCSISRSRSSEIRRKRSSSSTKSPGARATAPRRIAYAALIEKGPHDANVLALRAAETAVRRPHPRVAAADRAVGRAAQAAGAAAARALAAISGQVDHGRRSLRQDAVARELAERLAAVDLPTRGVDANANLAFAYATTRRRHPRAAAFVADAGHRRDARRAAARPARPGLRRAPRPIDRPARRGDQAAREPAAREPARDGRERAVHRAPTRSPRQAARPTPRRTSAPSSRGARNSSSTSRRPSRTSASPARSPRRGTPPGRARSTRRSSTCGARRTRIFRCCRRSRRRSRSSGLEWRQEPLTAETAETAEPFGLVGALGGRQRAQRRTVSGRGCSKRSSGRARTRWPSSHRLNDRRACRAGALAKAGRGGRCSRK